jgi:probable HAF family extracellular repeat protein
MSIAKYADSRAGWVKIKTFITSLRRKNMKLKSLALFLGLVVLASLPMSAQVSYTFQTVKYPKDTFTQLLGINNSARIAGYHGAAVNRGFTLILPKNFTNENYPQSAMTQVTGINNKDRSSGFYVDSNNVTHGFTFGPPVNWLTIDFPGSAFNQLLSLNDIGQASGYYSMSVNNTTPDFPYIYDQFGGVFEVITIPGAVGGAQATGINNLQQVCGFYIDSNQVNHGFLLTAGTLKKLDAPNSTFTQALGLNNKGQVVGVYTDQSGNMHGFVYSKGKFQIIDDPHGNGTMTVVNGINDNGQLVGFYVDAETHTDGLVATPTAGAEIAQ